MIKIMVAAIMCVGLYYGFYPPALRMSDPVNHQSWLMRVINRVRDGPLEPASMDGQAYAADIELFSACLSAGLGPQQAAAAVATASNQPSWGHTAKLLALGIDVQRAWSDMATIPQLSELAHIASCSGKSGAALSEACQRIAHHHREQAKDEAIAQAEHAGVLIALPMTLCYLPAFFLLGLMPVLVGMGSNFFNLF